MEVKNSEGPATIFVHSFNFTQPESRIRTRIRIKNQNQNQNQNQESESESESRIVESCTESNDSAESESESESKLGRVYRFSKIPTATNSTTHSIPIQLGTNLFQAGLELSERGTNQTVSEVVQVDMVELINETSWKLLVIS